LDYTPTGVHQHFFEAFAAVVRQTAQFCGMTWLEPLVVHGAPRLDDAALDAFGARYRAYLAALCAEETDDHA